MEQSQCPETFWKSKAMLWSKSSLVLTLGTYPIERIEISANSGPSVVSTTGNPEGYQS